MKYWENKAELTERAGFIRKVFGLLIFQLLISTVCCIVAMNYPYLGLYLGNIFVQIVAIFFIHGIPLLMINYPSLRQKVPLNYILMITFCLAESLVPSILCSFFSRQTVITSFLMTLGIITILTLFSFKTNFCLLHSYKILFVLAIFPIFMFLYSFIFAGSFGYLVWSTSVAVFFGIFFVVDLELILDKIRLGMGFTYDDYIIVAMSLFVDILHIFGQSFRIQNSSSDY